MTNEQPRSHITSNYSRILARELRLQERDLPRLLRGTRLPGEILLPGDETLLTGAEQLQILRNARDISGDPALGLRIGNQLQPATHGPIGYLALSSPDLSTALHSLSDFLPVRIAFARLTLETSGSWLLCGMEIDMPAPLEQRRTLLECFGLILQATVETLVGKTVVEARFEFDFEAPSYSDRYREYFHAPILFSRARSLLRLPAGLMHTPNAAGDPESHALARDLCQRLLDQVPAAPLSMADRVRRLLLSMPPGNVSEEQVAQALFVSKRTLARRLGREQLGYREIREQLLAELAARHLGETGLSVEAIAALLGYHDSANFRRAFRRWYGCTPSEFRGDPSAPVSTGAGGVAGQQRVS